ncbi:hypothetical protein Sango_1308000 [Sesamum angolense]|uniref:Uncharacterized protein n=1 Tax=Sesamum angolense TaxID=2727404 RepID=A0AAE1WRQ5_9LAMI|nr:hypothetical protein Sango_1308000 [Sesamum angolense]
MCEDIRLRPQPSEAPRSATRTAAYLPPAGPLSSFTLTIRVFSSLTGINSLNCAVNCVAEAPFSYRVGLLQFMLRPFDGSMCGFVIMLKGLCFKQEIHSIICDTVFLQSILSQEFRILMDSYLDVCRFNANWGKFWAGNIYHQFESICQDVDDFMNKDTMKFVENQVQSVGVSVKRFYSNVVQDILPLSEDIVEPKVLLEDVDKKSWFCDSLRNSDALLAFELDHGTQFPKPPDADSPEEAETPLYLREDGDGKDDADNGVEENMPRGSAPLAENEIFSGSSDDDNENSMPTVVSSPALSAHDAGLPVVEDPTSDENTSLSAASVASADKVNEDNSVLVDSQPPSACNVVHGSFLKNGILGDSFSTKDVSSDENTSLSAVASAEEVNEDNSMLMDSRPPACNVVHGSFLKNGILGDSFSSKDVNSDENTSLFAASVASADKVNEDNSVLMDSQPPSACDVVHGSFVKNGILGDSFSTKDESFDMSSSDQSPELSFSYFSCDNEEEEEEEETDVFSSKSSISPKSSNVLESTSASFINKAENIDHSEAECNISIPSSRTAYETKAVDMLPAISILKSNGSLALTSTLADNNTFPSDGSDFVDGSFKSRHGEHYNDGQFAISPSEAGNEHEFGLGISGLMETVDLSPDVKHDERTVPFTGNYARVASHHRRNFRYYKDAFTSRKRLSKEYEHLAIMFGDIDIESSQHFAPRSLPSSPHTYADAVRTVVSRDVRN